MRIDVYFEKPSAVGGSMYATLVAQFCDEDLYTACFPSMEKIADGMGLIVTESIKEDIDLSDDYPEIETYKAEIKFDASVLHGMPWKVHISDKDDEIDIEYFYTEEDAKKFCERWEYELIGVTQ